MPPHSLETSDPDYIRGQTAARIAVRDAGSPRALAALHRFAEGLVESAERAAAQAEIQLRHARGFQDHLIALRQETTA